MDSTVIKEGPKEELWEKAKASGMSRRKFLLLLAGGGTAVVLVACTPKVTTPTPPTPPASTTPTPTPTVTGGSPIFDALQFFDRRQAAIVHAAAGRIIPGTPQDPGAKEAGAVVFIDRALDGYDQALQRDYIIGLEGIEDYAKAKYNKSFVDLTDQQQDDILTNLDSGSDEAKKYLPNPKGFFGTLLSHVRQGMFSDPIYGGNRDSVGWKLIGHSGVVFDHAPAVMACDVDFPKEYMGIQEYYANHAV